MDLPPFRSKLVDCRLLEIFCIRAQARNFIFGDVAPVQFPPVLGSFEDDCGGVGLELFFTDGFVSDRVGFRKLSGWPKCGGRGRLVCSLLTSPIVLVVLVLDSLLNPEASDGTSFTVSFLLEKVIETFFFFLGGGGLAFGLLAGT